MNPFSVPLGVFLIRFDMIVFDLRSVIRPFSFKFNLGIYLFCFDPVIPWSLSLFLACSVFSSLFSPGIGPAVPCWSRLPTTSRFRNKLSIWMLQAFLELFLELLRNCFIFPAYSHLHFSSMRALCVVISFSKPRDIFSHGNKAYLPQIEPLLWKLSYRVWLYHELMLLLGSMKDKCRAGTSYLGAHVSSLVIVPVVLSWANIAEVKHP